MKGAYGNLGLAAAAYNSGESRVSRWLAPRVPADGNRELCLRQIGEPVDKFATEPYP